MTTTTTTAPTVQLTLHDSAILSTLFDSEHSPSSTTSISISDKPSTPALPHISPALLPTLRAREAHAIRPLNTQSPSPAAIETAVRDLSSLIDAHPDYAPAYLNRAQATRLILDSSSGFFTAATLPLTTQLFSDLSTAIALTTPPTPTAPVSSLQADLLASAHTHCGYLLLKAASSHSVIDTALPSESRALPPPLTGLSSTELEELASRDFALGSRYGNKIARQLSVQTNPYAKACGAIVKEALRKEREEFALGGGRGGEMEMV